MSRESVLLNSRYLLYASSWRFLKFLLIHVLTCHAKGIHFHLHLSSLCLVAHNKASIGIATLSWWGCLRAPVTPRVMLSGVLYSWPARTPMPNISKSRGQTKSDPTGPPGWGLGRGLITLSRKKRIITETRLKELRATY